MLYRPNYCSNCGEKIERVNWGILASRRFCSICETEYKGHEYLIRGFVAVGLLGIVFGTGAYLQSGSQREPTLVRQPAKLVDRDARPEQEPIRPSSSNAVVPAKTPEAVANAPIQQSGGVRPTPQVKAEVAEAQYFCGAETKKGTPCSRRVKGNTRCFQHTGMPSMTVSDRSKN